MSQSQSHKILLAANVTIHANVIYHNTAASVIYQRHFVAPLPPPSIRSSPPWTLDGLKSPSDPLRGGGLDLGPVGSSLAQSADCECGLEAHAAERGAAADAAAAASTPATSAAGSKSSSSPSSMALSSASASVSASASHSALRRRKPGTSKGGAPRPLAEIATWFQPPSSLRCSAVSRCSARAWLGLGRRG